MRFLGIDPHTDCDAVAEVVIANTHKLKIISFTNKKTEKVDAEKLARIIKMQVLSGKQQVHPIPLTV